MFIQNVLIATCIFLHPVPTLSMSSKRSRLGSLRDYAEIVLRTIFLKNRLEEYKGYLIDQGYPAELVSREFSRAARIPRNDLLKAKVKDSKRIFPFVLTYNPNLPFNGLIKKHVHLLGTF